MDTLFLILFNISRIVFIKNHRLKKQKKKKRNNNDDSRNLVWSCEVYLLYIMSWARIAWGCLSFSKLVLNSDFSFKIGYHTKVKELSLSYYLPVTGERIVEFIPFPGILAVFFDRPTIWTSVAKAFFRCVWTQSRSPDASSSSKSASGSVGIPLKIPRNTSAMWNANSLVPGSNSGHWVHFLRR